MSDYNRVLAALHLFPVHSKANMQILKKDKVIDCRLLCTSADEAFCAQQCPISPSRLQGISGPVDASAIDQVAIDHPELLL